jgi:hypothetical protein
MPTPTNSDILIGLYRGFFLRTPDAEGYNFWVAQNNSGTSLSEIAAGFLAHPYAQNNLGYALESAGGKNNEDFVKAIYDNLLNGTGSEVPTSTEIDYWVALLSAAESPMSRSDMVLKFVTDSLSIDFTDEDVWPDAGVREAGQKRQQAIINSNDVAKTYITALGNSTAISEAAKLDPNLLALDPAFQASQNIIKGVTYDPSTSNSAKNFITNTAATSGNPVNAINNATDEQLFGTGGGPTPGLIFTLTIGQDNIQGTAGDDVILGVFDGGTTSNQNTLTAADVINGGDGTDSLYATLDVGSAGILPGAQYSNIENYFIRNVSGVNPANTFNFASVTGEEQVWNDRSNNDVVVTGLAAGATIGVKGNGAVVAGATNATYAADATAANIALDGGTATGSAAVTVNGGTGMTSATLTSTGAANSIGSLNLAAATTGLAVDAQTDITTGNIAGAGLKTVTVKGAGSANIGDLIASPAVTTVNAADNVGGVTATLNAQTNFKFTGGSGNDVITTGAVLVATASVDAGTGAADRLVVADTNHIRVDGTSKALGDLYKGFEQVQVQDGVNLNVENLSTNNTIDTVRIDDASGTTSVTNISATAARNVGILNAQGGITIGLKGATTTGQIDTVKAAVTTTTAVPAAQNISLLGIDLAGVENLELTGSNGPIAANVGRIQLDTVNAIDLAGIKLNNANSVDADTANDNIITVSAGSRAINLNIDAAGSGDTRIDASAYNTVTGATLTTGAGNDIIIGSARSDVINGGAGDDILDGGDRVTITPSVPTADQVVYDLSALSAVLVGDTAAVTINGTTYTGTAALATPVNLAEALAAQIQADIGTNAVLGTVTASNGVVTVTAATTGSGSNFGLGTSAVTYVTDPAAAPLAADVTTTVPAADATAAGSTLTFNTAAGSFAVGDVIAYSIDDGDGGSAETVTYTVLGADIVAGDPVATAANIAAKVASQFNLATASVTAVRIGNVVTVASDNPGQSGNDESWTATLDITNTATGVTLAEVSNGTDATAQSVTIDFNVPSVTYNAGDVVTIDWNDGAPQTVSYTVLAGDTATEIAAGLDAAWAGATANVSNALGVLTIQDASAAGAAATITDVSTTIDAAPITTTPVAGVVTEGDDGVSGMVVVAAADTLTGGEGNDAFVINYSNVDTAGQDLIDQVTFSAMDAITDLNLGGNVAGTNVDTIQLPFAVTALVNAGTPVAMAATAADLYDAVQALYALGGTLASAAAGTAGLFTYGGDAYLIADQFGSGDGFAATDIIIKVTGFTGTLSLTDLVV